MVEAPRTNLKRSGRFLWIPAVAVVAAGGYAAFRFANRPDSSSPPVLSVPSSPALAAEPVAPAPPPAERPAGADEAPSLLESVSANALFRRSLAQADLIHRWAVVTDNLAEDRSPRRALAFLSPRGPFSVALRGNRLVISSQSYARYDAIADAVDSIDARALAIAYRRLHGAIEVAYQALGLPPGSLDRATSRALQRIATAPVAAGEVYVESEEGVYVFSDPQLERLGDVEKQLVRMGPRNERLVQSKARELLATLELPVVAAERR